MAAKRMAAKRRCVVRLRIGMYDFFRKRGKTLGMKTGTYLSCLVENEALAASEQENYQFTPMLEEILPSQRSTEKTASNQVSIYLTEEAFAALEIIKKRTGYESSRELINGLLLNTETGRAYMIHEGYLKPEQS